MRLGIPKVEEAIVALLTHPTVDAAARAIDVAPTTLMRWLKDPEIDGAYRAARRAAFRQSIARLPQGSTAAATTLLKTTVPLDAGTLATRLSSNRRTPNCSVEFLGILMNNMRRGEQRVGAEYSSGERQASVLNGLFGKIRANAEIA